MLYRAPSFGPCTLAEIYKGLASCAPRLFRVPPSDRARTCCFSMLVLFPKHGLILEASGPTCHFRYKHNSFHTEL